MITATITGKQPVSYPMLMNDISNINLIVLMIKEGTGVVVHTPSSKLFNIGDYLNQWDMDSFKPYTGSVELRNA